MLPLSALIRTGHAALRSLCGPGDVVLDGTAGNGHDTAFLADLVGPEGLVLALDRQQEALDRTADLLRGRKTMDRVRLLRGEHRELGSLLSGELPGPADSPALTAAVFNLGFLPGGDKTVITEAASTLAALDAVWPRIRPGGLLSVHAYSGHAGALEERDAVAAWMDRLPWNEAQVVSCASHNKPSRRETLFLAFRGTIRKGNRR